MSINPFFLDEEFNPLSEGKGRGAAERSRMKLFALGQAVRDRQGNPMLGTVAPPGYKHNKNALMADGPNVTHAVDNPAKAATREMNKATHLGGILTDPNPQDPMASKPEGERLLGAVLKQTLRTGQTVAVDSKGKPMLRKKEGDPVSATANVRKASTDVTTEKARKAEVAAKRQAFIDNLKASLNKKNEAIELQERKKRSKNAVSVQDIKDAGVVLQDDPAATVSRKDLITGTHKAALEPAIPPTTKGILSTTPPEGATSSWQRTNVGGATRPAGKSPSPEPALDTGSPSKKAGSLGHAGNTASYPYGVPPASSAKNFPARPDEVAPDVPELVGSHEKAKTKYGPTKRDLSKDDIGHIGVPTQGGKLRSLTTVTGITRFAGKVPTDVTVPMGDPSERNRVSDTNHPSPVVHTKPDSGTDFEVTTIHARPPKRSRPSRQDKATIAGPPKGGIGPNVVKGVLKDIKTSGKAFDVKGAVDSVFDGPKPKKTVSADELERLRSQQPGGFKPGGRKLPTLKTRHDAKYRNRR